MHNFVSQKKDNFAPKLTKLHDQPAPLSVTVRSNGVPLASFSLMVVTHYIKWSWRPLKLFFHCTHSLKVKYVLVLFGMAHRCAITTRPFLFLVVCGRAS